MNATRNHAILSAILILATVGAFGSGASEERSFSAFGIDAVSVKAQFLDVQVSANNGFTVSMTTDLPQDSLFQSAGYRVLHEQVGSRLSIWVEKDDAFFSGTRGGTISLQVPRGIDIQLETISGRIAVQGVESRNLAVNTVSGRIILEGIRGSLDVSSVSGGISLDTIEARIKAKSVSGTIEGKGISFSEESSFSSVSGNINMRLDTALDRLCFDLSTLSGRIVVGNVRAEKGLRMGLAGTSVHAQTVSGSLIFR